MMPAAGGLPSVILALTAAFVASGLVLLIVLAPSGRGRAARTAVVAGVLALGLAILTTSRRAASERTPSGVAPHAPSEIAIAVPAPPVPPVAPPVPDDEEEPAEDAASADDESVTITDELPDIPEVAKEVLNGMRMPVRFEGSKLVIGGHPIQTPETGPSSRPGELTERKKHATEVEVRTTVRRDAAERLSEYFQQLVDEPPPAIPRLSELRSTLQRLSAEQRARIAERAARQRTVIARRGSDSTGDSETDGVEFYAPDIKISPEQLRSMIKSELAREKRAVEVSTPAKFFGTIGVVVGAVVALKLATRRHCGVNPRPY